MFQTTNQQPLNPQRNPGDLDVQLPRQRNQLPIPKLGLKRVWRVLGSAGRDDDHVDGLFMAVFIAFLWDSQRFSCFFNDMFMFFSFFSGILLTLALFTWWSLLNGWDLENMEFHTPSI